jgi:hypothetical protein
MEKFLPEEIAEPGETEWSSVRGHLKCPRNGTWRVLFTLSQHYVLTQILIAGLIEVLELTEMEQLTLSASVPTE